jgi:nicotinamidase-related amidase
LAVKGHILMDKQPISRSALVVVDIQDSFTTGSRWSQRHNPDFETNVMNLLAAYREAGLPVFFIMHTDSDPGFRKTDPEFRLMSFIGRRENEPLVVKNTRNSFTSTDLQQRLDALGVKRLAIVGITTEQCCETTTRVAADLGYDVDFVSQATLTFPIVSRAGVEELSADEIVRRTELVLRDRFARITTVSELQRELAEELQPSAM